MKKLLISAVTILLVSQVASPSFGASLQKSFIIKHLGYGTNNQREFSLYPRGGTFCSLINGEVVFFSCSQFRDFHNLLIGSPRSLKMTLLFLNPNTKRVKKTVGVVRSNDCGELSINDQRLSDKSVKRLRLTSDWQKVLQIKWPYGSSIVALGGSRFVISGGFDNLNLPSSNVIVYNVKNRSKEQEFKLNKGRAYHNSVLLSDGRIFCVGGTIFDPTSLARPTNFAEIIDLAAETSEAVSAVPSQRTAMATICTDENGNPVIFGGVDSSTSGFSFNQVVKFNLLSREFEQVGSLHTGRYFDRGPAMRPSFELIEECVEQLDNGSFIIDGGDVNRPCPYADFASGPAETGELIWLK